MNNTIKAAVLHGAGDLRIEDEPLDAGNLKSKELYVETQITGFKSRALLFLAGYSLPGLFENSFSFIFTNDNHAIVICNNKVAGANSLTGADNICIHIGYCLFDSTLSMYPRRPNRKLHLS